MSNCCSLIPITIIITINTTIHSPSPLYSPSSALHYSFALASAEPTSDSLFSTIFQLLSGSPNDSVTVSTSP
jgi:hypothetical protein